MSFAIFSDSSCNLPKAQLEEFQVQIISSSYEREGKLITCPPYPEDFDGHEYYNFLRNKGVVKTSLIPAAQMEDAFRPVLAAGEDVLYITLSSGGIPPTASAGAGFHGRWVWYWSSPGPGLRRSEGRTEPGPNLCLAGAGPG